MNFNDIIQLAKNSENDLYFKKKKENYFNIHRRDARRLQLCCRRDPKSCSYSIRCNFTNSPNGILKIQEANHIHSCGVKFLSKRANIADSIINSILPRKEISVLSNELSVFSSQDSSSSVAAAAAAAAATICNVKKGGNRSVLSMPVESSREECGNTKHSQKENSLLSNELSSTDDEYVFSSQPYILSQDSSSSVAAAAAAGAAATICNVKKGGPRIVLSMPVESSREECGNTKHSGKENSLLSNESSSSDDENVFSTRISKLMGVFDSLQLSTEQKMHMSLSLGYLLNHQFGLPLVSLLFCEYEKVQRDQMIFDLQLLRSLHFPEKNSTTYISPRSIPADDPPNCRKRKFEIEFDEDDSEYEKKYDEDDGDIVFYVDKPNTFL